jgi:hypothetical protein
MDPHNAKDVGNGTSVVFVPQTAINPTNEGANSPEEMIENSQGGYFIISNTETDEGRPFLRGQYATEAEAEAASRGVTWTEEMLRTAWSRPTDD